MSQRYEVNERRYVFYPLQAGVELKVTAHIKGWRDEGITGLKPEDCVPPDGDEEAEVEEVLLLAYGHAYDLTEDYLAGTAPDLMLDVEEALVRV